ncbi:uncharacterized protein LOC114240761 [Bombyx mandarina]|uniref:Uncharacterized protein n=2 Tax=Bombyx TaxID=7090 RepID=A0A8R1WIY7_BOMMO|nr:uncharacterized protein LOC101743355 [Bombyx mori]XP_028027230.1 uncharacterized protein LOC114240761 [Bombyx mandarina]
MTSLNEQIEHPSFFWNCLALQDDCPFYSSIDPKLYYFAVGLTCIYAAFFVIILADLQFYWSLDGLQQKIDYYSNLVRKKVRRVQMNQQRLVSTQERTEKQLKRSRQSTGIITGLRGTLSMDETPTHSLLAICENETTKYPTYCSSQHAIEF